MKILVTNDDGYMAPGIRALVKALEGRHEVWLCAPDGERSGMSHSMSLRHPIKLQRLGEREYSCSGSPADCVILAGHGVLPFKPELVVSGINRGPNLGTDLIYSGTAAAARQAALIGIPGIAVSLATYTAPFRYNALAALVADKLPELLALWSPEVFLNLNAPDAPDGFAYELAETVPSTRRYKDTLKVFEGPDNHSYCFFTDGHVESHEESGSDEEAVRHGLAAITRVLVQPQAANTGTFPALKALEAAR